MTGATGNLGTALLRLPAAEFVPVSRRDWSRLPELFGRGVDAVLHAAWDLNTPLTQSPEAVLDANLMTTMRLLEACRKHRVPKFALVHGLCRLRGET